jgi:hypothetical protein
MKKELKKLLYIPKNKEDIYKELQKLWDRVDLCNFRYYIEQLICKIEDIIAIHRLAIIN